jgi:hypothetical protein
VTDVEWRTIARFPGYEVSSDGRVRSIDRKVRRSDGKLFQYKGRERCQSVSVDGYLRVKVGSRTSSVRTITVHRLVAIAFVPNPKGLRTVNHRNGNKLDNRAANLEWMTRLDNLRHAQTHGLLRPPPPGELHPNAKLTNREAALIRSADYSVPGTRVAMARRYGISVDTVTLIRKGLRYPPERCDV